MAKTPTTTAEAEKTAPAAPTTTLVVHSRGVDGFRRAGLAFRAGRNELPLADIDPQQIAMLRTEPLLSVEIVGAPAPEPKPEGGQ